MYLVYIMWTKFSPYLVHIHIISCDKHCMFGYIDKYVLLIHTTLIPIALGMLTDSMTIIMTSI